jgi:SAM-dependent methyltransferase
MDLELVKKSFNYYKDSLQHCKNFKFTDLKLTESAKEMWNGKDVARLPAVYFFNKYIKELQLFSKKLLTFGGLNDIEVKVLPHNEWVNSDYWQKQEDDVEDLSQSQLKTEFDFILINQTFEHLTNIEAAICNIKKLLVQGGYFYANFPVLNIPHGHPFNFFTGISTQYLIYLCLKYNLKIIRSGEWGNKDYINYIYSNLGWPDYKQINLDNDDTRPCIGWILAQKHD